MTEVSLGWPRTTDWVFLMPHFLRRRRWIVDAFQLRLLVTLLLQHTIIVVLAGVIVVLPILLELRQPSELTRSKADTANAFLYLHKHMWLAGGALLALMTVYLTIMTHRIAGPLYRFRQVFQAAGRGDLSVRVRIRKTDYLHDEARSLEAMIDELRKLVSNIRDRSDRAVSALESLRRAAPEQRGPVAGVLKHLDESLKQLRASVEAFKIDA